MFKTTVISPVGRQALFFRTAHVASVVFHDAAHCLVRVSGGGMTMDIDLITGLDLSGQWQVKNLDALRGAVMFG